MTDISDRIVDDRISNRKNLVTINDQISD